ncbi:MAG: hypothetical protein EOO77_42525, partial [Oxalobacteraceae bacterium]
MPGSSDDLRLPGTAKTRAVPRPASLDLSAERPEPRSGASVEDQDRRVTITTLDAQAVAEALGEAERGRVAWVDD